MSGSDSADPAAIDVSIIIVSYNTREMTLACLDSIFAQTRKVSFEILIHDNGSSDGSVEAIARYPEALRLTAAGVNHGFAHANNLAVAQARGDYILLLNPDTVVTNGAIDELVAFARRTPDARIWGGRTTFCDGRLNGSSCWAAMSPWSLFCRAVGLSDLFRNRTFFNPEAFGGWGRDCERAVDIVSGCFFLISRRDWQVLGGFDPIFFMYGEEADLCLRARAIGARPRITPAATIVHHGGASEASRAAKLIKLLAAKATLIRRHWNRIWVPAGLALLALWPFSRWIGFTVAALIASRDADIERAATWSEVWTKRDQWITGYKAVAHDGVTGQGEVLAA